MQLNLEAAFKFWVLQFSGACLQKEGKRLAIPEPIHYYVFFSSSNLFSRKCNPTQS
jgi:hypothetical protein